MLFSVLGPNYWLIIKKHHIKRWMLDRRVEFEIKQLLAKQTVLPELAYQPIFTDTHQAATRTLIKLGIPYIAILSCRNEENKYKALKYKERHRYYLKRAQSVVLVDRTPRYALHHGKLDEPSADKFTYVSMYIRDNIVEYPHIGIVFGDPKTSPFCATHHNMGYHFKYGNLVLEKKDQKRFLLTGDTLSCHPDDDFPF